MWRLSIAALALFAACGAPQPGGAAQPSGGADVEVVGAPVSSNDDVIATVDAALRKNGKLGAEADLSAGVSALARENRIRITVRADGYFVEIAPRSGAGHDVALRVDPATLALHDVVVGEVEPPPD